jgi:hypothetical protein
MATDSRQEAMQNIIDGFQKKPPSVQEIATANEAFRDPAEFIAEDVDRNPQYEPDAPGIEADFEPAPTEDPVEKLKIDGEEREVPQSKVLEEGRRAMQKELAADKRLEEAALLKKQYEELLARANQQFTPPPPVEEDLTEAIQNAAFDPEAARKLAQAIRGRDAATPDVMQLVREEIQNQHMLDRFKTEFKDIVEDERALTLAASMEAQKRQAGDKRPLYDIWSEVGNDIRTWKAGLSGQTKQEAKAKLQDINVASARIEQKDTPRPPTMSEVIDRLAKSRGQLPPSRSI